MLLGLGSGRPNSSRTSWGSQRLGRYTRWAVCTVNFTILVESRDTWPLEAD